MKEEKKVATEFLDLKQKQTHHDKNKGRPSNNVTMRTRRLQSRCRVQKIVAISERRTLRRRCRSYHPPSSAKSRNPSISRWGPFPPRLPMCDRTRDSPPRPWRVRATRTAVSYRTTRPITRRFRYDIGPFLAAIRASFQHGYSFQRNRSILSGCRGFILHA